MTGSITIWWTRGVASSRLERQLLAIIYMLIPYLPLGMSGLSLSSSYRPHTGFDYDY